MEYKLSDDTWDQNELNALNRVIDSNMFSMGKNVQQYERDFSERFGVKYSVMVNSGSSANLLAVAALVYSGRLQAGDEVIVPAVSWSTTYFPICQFGLKLRFVDIDINTLNLDCEQIARAITDKTKMIFAVNLLGNPNDFDYLSSLCKEHNLLLVEDNCESLGAEYKGKKLGTIGMMGTFSTFYSHHLCTMEGGIVVTDDEELYHYMLCIRAHGWTRNLPKDSPIYQKSADAFYESFNFIVPGFNFRPLEMEGALGIEQLKKMDLLISNRIENAGYFLKKMREIQGVRVQKEIEKSSWFGFSIVLDEALCGKRDSIARSLTDAGIEIRPIVAGNFTRNKVISYLNYSVSGNLKNADYVHENGFFIGNYGRNNFAEIDYFCYQLKRICSELGCPQINMPLHESII